MITVRDSHTRRLYRSQQMQMQMQDEENRLLDDEDVLQVLLANEDVEEEAQHFKYGRFNLDVCENNKQKLVW